MPADRTHYDVLQIRDGAEVTLEVVKQAYHRALLVHHPDKAQQANAKEAHVPLQASASSPTIDQIVTAYAVLSDPNQRKSYDTALKISPKRNIAHRGIDSFDLDDMHYSEKDGRSTWQRNCRCDSVEGYVVTEQDLERADREQEAEQDGSEELLVPCRGCSLFIRVTFAVTGE